MAKKKRYITPEERQANRAFREGKKCCNCESEDRLTVDHIRPLALGHGLEGNRQVLCWQCNHEKDFLSIDYSTRTFILEPFVMGLHETERRWYLTNPHTFASWYFKKD